MWAIVIGLAAFRIYRIAGVDQITEPFHGRLNASRHRVGMWFSDLVSCPWCIGWWASLGLATLGWAMGLFTWQEAIPIALAASAVCGITGHVTAALQAHAEAHSREPESPVTQLWVNVNGDEITVDGPEREQHQDA